MAADHVAVLFHGIGTPGRALEPGEAPYWIGVDLFEALLDRIAAHPLRARLHISFDDGNLSDHAIALPRLLARGLRADFFVLSGRLGVPGSLGTAELRELAAAGMGVGSHGIAHRDWRRLEAAGLRAELAESRDVLEQALGAPVRAVGIPFGGYDRRVLRAIRAAGYAAAWSSDGGRMDPAAFLRPRTSVRADMEAGRLETLLEGHLPPVRRLRRALGMAQRRFLPV